VIIVGRVTGVMETWPLQLAVQTSAGIYHVLLRENATVTSGGHPVSPGRLRAGHAVRVDGESSGPQGITATGIEITGTGP
jgi:hypothetical protein